MLTHVQIVHVPVADQDRARHFYVDLLGLELVDDCEMGPHGRWLQVAPEGAATSLALVPGHDGLPAGSTGGLVFETSDLDADVARLREHGIDVPDGIDEMPWARVARFVDPDGNELVMQTATVDRG